MEDFIRLIEYVVETQSAITNAKSALKHMKIHMDTLLMPYIQRYKQAKKYVLLRDENNKHLLHLLKSIDTQLKQLFINFKGVTILPMSSICAKMNMISESDIDFGLMIQDMSKNNLIKIACILEDNGFKYNKTFVGSVKTNLYHSFCKYDKNHNVEIEIKVRDYESSKIIIDMHMWLDTNFSDDERTMITYAKYLLKQHDKSFNTAYYGKFKKILYESVFYCIGGDYLLM